MKRRQWPGRGPNLWATERWKRLSRHKRQLQPICERCHAESRIVAAACVDHREPHHGDPAKFWVPLDQLQSLCSNCHNSRKKFEERHGFSKGCDINGYPTDPRHPCFDDEAVAAEGADLSSDIELAEE